MKNNLLILIFIFVTASIFAEYTLDLNFALMPESKIKIGKIQIRNINDLREDIFGNKNIGLDYIGNIRKGLGIPYKCESTINIDIIFKSLFIEALKYAGFNATDYAQSDKIPVLDIDIIDCFMDGFSRIYGIAVKVKFKLSRPDDNEILFEKTIISSASLFLDKRSSRGVNLYVTNAYHRALNRILKTSSTVFTSQNFINAYHGKKYEKETEVDFSEKKISAIPVDIKNKEKIEILNLHNNMIGKIENLNDYNSLIELDLGVNYISEIKNLDKLNNLIILSLANNRINSIKNLDNLKNLKDLDINNNFVKKIENLNNLVNIEWLVLSANYIENIKNLTELKNLMFLDISNNKKIKKIENLDDNKKLVWLNLNSTGIVKIENLENLSNLIYLDLSNCDISKIENLDNLKNLLYLNLGFNTWIKKIEGLDNLTNLKKLNLSDSIYKTIEGLDNLKNLEELNLSRNPIKKIENLDKLTNLKILNLSLTNITVLENLENLKNLESLIISPFRIKKIKKETYDFLKSKNWKFTGITFFKRNLVLDDFIKNYFIKIE